MNHTRDAEVPPAWDDMVLVGFIARTHGNRGEVIVNSETDFAERRFRVGATLYARQGRGLVEALGITGVRFQQGRPILRIAGFSSIGDAERLAGCELRVPESEQEPLPAGTYYHHQLVGCDVVTKTGDQIGRVAAVHGDGAATRLVVSGGRGEVLIPLAEEICAVDVRAKRIVIDPPEGLLELNGNFER